MKDRMFDRQSPEPAQGALETVVADAAGMVWAHSNPAELYRWVSRRNALLRTIADACLRVPTRPMAGPAPATPGGGEAAGRPAWRGKRSGTGTGAGLGGHDSWSQPWRMA